MGGTFSKDVRVELPLPEQREQIKNPVSNEMQYNTPIGGGKSSFINSFLRMKSSQRCISVGVEDSPYKQTESRNVESSFRIWVSLGAADSAYEYTKCRNDYDVNLRVLRQSLPMLNNELGTDVLVSLFHESEIVTFEEMCELQKLERCLRTNKMKERLKGIRSGSYDAFIRCLVESGYEYLVRYLEEQGAKFEGMIMPETEKWWRSDNFQFCTKSTMVTGLNLHARPLVLGINMRYLWTPSFWNEDLNSSFLSDSNEKEKDIGPTITESDKETFQYKYEASDNVSLHTDNVLVEIVPIDDDSCGMQADEGFREIEQMLMCKVCLDADLDILFLPCRHMATCERCAGALQNCPVCRSTIQDSVKLNYE